MSSPHLLKEMLNTFRKHFAPKTEKYTVSISHLNDSAGENARENAEMGVDETIIREKITALVQIMYSVIVVVSNDPRAIAKKLSMPEKSLDRLARIQVGRVFGIFEDNTISARCYVELSGDNEALALQEVLGRYVCDNTAVRVLPDSMQPHS